MRTTVCVLASLLVLACGSGPSAGSAPTGPPGFTIPDPTAAPTSPPAITPEPSVPGVLASSLPRCSAVGDLRPTAPDDWYAGTPVYVSNEMPIEQAMQFSSSLPGFQTGWIDRDHRGWVTIGFSGTDIAARQADLEAEFPEAGIVAVEMFVPLDELEAMRSRIHSRLPDGMHAHNTNETAGWVEIWMGDITDERLAIVEEVVGEHRACVGGWLPGEHPPQGPQPQAGDGWRLLAVVDSGAGERARIVTERARLEAMWRQLAIEEPPQPPRTDFGPVIVVGFEIGYSGSCPETRLDDVVVDGSQVYAEVVHTSREQACTDDYNPRTYLVTVDRSVLPTPPFTVSSRADAPSRMRVDADLRPPGSALSPEQVGPVSVDPAHVPTSFPTITEPGFPTPITIDVGCGIEFLGEINGTPWRTAGGTADLPSAWAGAVADGLLDLEVTVTPWPDVKLTAVAGGHEVRYLPTDDQPPSC